MNSLPLPASIRESGWFWAPAAAISCAVLFAVPALFPEFYLLGWLAFVPFLLGLQQCRSLWQAYGFGLLTGLLAFGFATYWMAEFIRIFKAYSVVHSVGLASLYWLYCAQMFAVIAVLTHYARRGNAVLWVFPTALTLVLAFYPALFPWQLGNTQSEFLVAIQATDIAGVSGLDFILGIVAVLIAQAIIGQKVFFQRGALVAYGLLGAWLIYGVFSLAYWDSPARHRETLRLGLVQANEPPGIGIPDPRPGFSLGYPIEMDLTEQLVGAGAELVIWPELRDKQYFRHQFVQAAYQQQVAELASPLLFQSLEEEVREGKTLTFNTAVLIDADGDEAGKYRKIKRIAMAEYLPLFENSKAVEGWLRQQLGQFFGDYSAGAAPEAFDVGTATISPFICYEVTFSHFVAASSNTTGGDILVAQSNNGWFGDTRVPYQHMAASVLRSVENRRPLVHVMNNGLGGVTLPSGRTLLRTAHHEIAGYLLEIPYERNGITTFYSRFPYWFVTLLGLSLVLMLVRTLRSS